MDLILTRIEFRADGIFSELRAESGVLMANTLEHSYQDADGEFYPKLPDGEYRCVRGFHSLDHIGAVETFEVLGVPGHKGILFHVGNFNHDSDGCILLGTRVTTINEQKSIGQSRIAFHAFMEIQRGNSEFLLTVKSS